MGKRLYYEPDAGVYGDSSSVACQVAATQTIVDRIHDQLSLESIESNKRAYKTLCSLDLPQKSWDALLTLSTIKIMFAHFDHELLKLELMEALVSISSSSEYPVRRLYAYQMLPVVIKAIQSCESIPFMEGCLTLCISFMEVIGEPAAIQCVSVVNSLSSVYRESTGRFRLKIAEFLESLSEDQALPSIPNIEPFSLKFDDETMAQLCLVSAMMNNEMMSNLHVIEKLILFIDAFRKQFPSEAVISFAQSNCLRKVYELMTNAFCGETITDSADLCKHLETIIADDACKYLESPTGDLIPSVLNAFANYLNAVGQCSLGPENIDTLKKGLIKLLKDGEQMNQTASTNLLRAMSLTCDFTLSPEEELSIYSSLQSNFEAAINVAQIVFFCTPSSERENFIRNCLNCSVPICIIEYVDSMIQFGGSIDKRTISTALLRAESLATDKFCLDRIKELKCLIK